MEEVQAAIEIAKAPVEIIKVPCEVGEIAVRIASGTVEGLRSALYFVQSIREQYLKEKVSGETNVDKLMKVTGGDVMMIQVDEQRLQEVKSAMKEWGVLYCEASDLNVKDGKREIMFPTNASPRVIQLAEKMGLIQNESFKMVTPQEYVDNATEDKKAEYDEEIKKMKMSKPEKDLSPEQKRFMNMGEYEKCLSNPDLQTFTINKKMVHSVTDDYIESRIPRTDDYVRMPVDKLFLLDNEKTYFVFTDPNSKLEVFGPDGTSKGMKTAKELYSVHYRTRTMKPFAAKTQTPKVQSGKIK
ncbi:MAG: DUF3801 domain-containing protein [Lachnospiraceae bacterium]|nr:DUF3801 domain-containing protein [Lachnospiraceae bacterium]